MDRIERFGIVILLLSICLLLNIASPSLIAQVDRTNITVDDDGDGDYTSIKEALSNAKSGDTIEVYSGIYYEHDILIEKKDITLKGIPNELGDGNATGKPFINGQGLPPGLLTFRADGVTFSGFYIENDGQEASGAITLNNVNNCLISDNSINHTLGSSIYCKNSTHIRIINNSLRFSNIRQGICFHGCTYFTISGNVISDMSHNGILAWESHNNTITNNIISRCGLNGICLLGNNNFVYNNQIENNQGGLDIGVNSGNVIKQNNFMNNEVYNAFFYSYTHPRFYTKWINNYWDRPRILPYLIFGRVYIFIPWFNFDWNPAKEPYDINVTWNVY